MTSTMGVSPVEYRAEEAGRVVEAEDESDGDCREPLADLCGES
jgi:hypothetical protein